MFRHQRLASSLRLVADVVRIMGSPSLPLAPQSRSRSTASFFVAMKLKLAALCKFVKRGATDGHSKFSGIPTMLGAILRTLNPHGNGPGAWTQTLISAWLAIVLV